MTTFSLHENIVLHDLNSLSLNESKKQLVSFFMKNQEKLILNPENNIRINLSLLIDTDLPFGKLKMYPLFNVIQFSHLPLIYEKIENELYLKRITLITQFADSFKVKIDDIQSITIYSS
jgi:hypothetical protein